MIIKKRREFRPDEPANFGIREAPPQGRKSRQGKDYVAKRTGFDYKDIFYRGTAEFGSCLI
jgi:hypothetical protein